MLTWLSRTGRHSSVKVSSDASHTAREMALSDCGCIARLPTAAATELTFQHGAQVVGRRPPWAMC